MRILTLGDVCGSNGCRAVMRLLPQFKKEQQIDFTVINGENSADGNGITPQSADDLFACGADVITGGNHSLRRKEVYGYLDDNDFVLRPDNLVADYGKGYCTVDLGKTQVAVLNLAGQIYADARQTFSNPFLAADRLVGQAKKDGVAVILVDFHAEATSEKRALGFYLDGKVSAVFGTHTHVQTADAQILPAGTGYITDIGMSGTEHSVLGIKKEIIIDRLRNGGTQKFELAQGPAVLNGCIFEVEERTGKTVSATSFTLREETV